MDRRMNPLSWLAVALVVAIVLMIGLGTWAMTTYGGYYGMMGGSWTWGLAMMAVPGIVLVVVLLAALGLLDEPAAVSVGPVAGPKPQTILDERYARGELSREDYLRARDDLESGRAHS